ncbi:MAG: enoyl-CoA hydratase/isomerase family protein [Pseudomonadales bacterium]
MTELIRAQHHGNVLSLTLNRSAQKNALSIKLLRELCESLSSEVADDSIAVIISGTGGCFSAGADLSDLKGNIEDLAVDDAVAEAVQAIRSTHVPVIAAIDGPCLGAAVDLCLACDLRVASADAYFQIPATRLGLLYNPAAVSRIAELTPPDTLFRLLVLGEKFEAEEAYRVGLLSYTVSVGASREAAIAIAQATSANVPVAVAASKGLLNALQNGDYDANYWNEVRNNILASPQRRAAVDNAKNH